jgi:hypothetical protein
MMVCKCSKDYRSYDLQLATTTGSRKLACTTKSNYRTVCSRVFGAILHSQHHLQVSDGSLPYLYFVIPLLSVWLFIQLDLG